MVNLGPDHLTLEGGEGWFLVIKNFFFRAVWWAGYFSFSHKQSITFVLHAIFFFQQALAGNFFSKSPTPAPPSRVKWSAPYLRKVQSHANLVPFCLTFSNVEYLARLKWCNSMCSEIRTLTQTHFTYLDKIFKFSHLNPTRPVPKIVCESSLTHNSTEPIFRVLVKV